jgi:hypothetical protein
MKTQNRGVSLMVFSCMTFAALLGCDQSEDGSISDLQASGVIDPLEVVMSPGPATFHGSVPAVDHTIASNVAAAESDTIPVVGDAHRFAPNEEDVIGWVRWAMAEPYFTGPVADQTGELCGVGQEGPVWYLAGTFGGPVERECDIPAGKQLSFPLLNGWCVFPSEFYADDEAIAADVPLIDEWYASSFANVCSLTLRLDGEDLIPSMETMVDGLYVTAMDPFEIDLNDAHWATEWFAGGEMPAVGAGYYARLQPLTPGDHVLELGGTFCGEGAFSTYATYHLHVGG